MKKKIRCGITGHTGSIGRNLIKLYRDKIIFHPFKGDVTKKKQILKWIKSNRFDHLIHLAALVPIKEVNDNKKKAYKVNTLGTKNIVDVITKEKKQLDWVFFASTSHVYSSSKKKLLKIQKLNQLAIMVKQNFLQKKKLVN